MKESEKIELEKRYENFDKGSLIRIIIKLEEEIECLKWTEKHNMV